MENPFLPIEQQMLGDIHTSSAVMDTLTVLCDDFGSRFTGTPQEHQAAEYFAQCFRDYGLQNVHKEAYTFIGWDRGPATLEIAAPVQKQLGCISLPGCPPAQVEADVVFLRDGAPADFERAGDSLNGAIVMVCSRPPRGVNRTVHRSEKYQRAALGGAAAFLYQNQYPGYGPETGSISNDREALIPGIGISFEDGAYLLRLQERFGTVRLRLRTTDRSGEKTSYNVVAELPGNQYPDEWVVVGCHYDGHDIAQGAEDPASGAVALLEAARVLAKYAAERLECGVRFIEFGTEEIGLLGAKRYVDAHAAELDPIRFMLNLDASGGAGRKGVIVNRWPELEPFFAQAAHEMATRVPIGQKTSGFSDHFPFFLAGVPTGMMGDPDAANTGRGFGHTQWDTLDKIEIANLREAASVAARLALRMACHPEWPVRRRPTEAVATLIAAEPALTEMWAVRDRMEALYRERAG